METLIVTSVLAVLVIGRLYAGKLASEFISSLPADERARLQRALTHSSS